MIHMIDNKRVNVIGDPHLGRVFKTGVPLHRMGEREELVWKDFADQLGQVADICIIMGDLFDKFVVPPEVVIRAYQYLNKYSRALTTVVLRGNHDASRDATKQSSFDLLEVMARRREDLKVLKDPAMVMGFLCIPWHPFKSSKELVEEYAGVQAQAAFGHWDLESFGGSEHNIVPLEQLAKITTRVFTGHIHTPEERFYPQHNITLTVTGSMQPYSHAEDPSGDLYMTLTLAQTMQIRPEVIKDRNVRILLTDGEELTEELNCLSVVTKRIAGEVDEEKERNIEVNFGDFDFRNLFQTTMKENGVGEATTNTLYEKYLEMKQC